MKTEKDFNILVGCEESQTICIAFRKLGFEAYSCYLQDCSGCFPEWHITGDAVTVLNSKKWDLVIAHPPCTRMANSGCMWGFSVDFFGWIIPHTLVLWLRLLLILLTFKIQIKLCQKFCNID